MYEQNENPWNDPQDSQSQQEMYHRNPEPGNASNGLAVAALICSVLSIVSVCCLYGAFVFGGLAIIFALLSRGARKKTYGAAHTALLIGTAGVLISVVITIGMKYRDTWVYAALVIVVIHFVVKNLFYIKTGVEPFL